MLETVYAVLVIDIERWDDGDLCVEISPSITEKANIWLEEDYPEPKLNSILLVRKTGKQVQGCMDGIYYYEVVNENT